MLKRWPLPGSKLTAVVPCSYIRSCSDPEENIYLTTVSLQPKVFEVSSFLKESECDSIISDAEPHLSDSGVATKDSDVGKDASTWRISEYYCAKRKHVPRHAPQSFFRPQRTAFTCLCPQ